MGSCSSACSSCKFLAKFRQNVARRMSNVECRMSKMVRKRLEPCQKSLQRLSDVALCARKGEEKRKMKGNQICEKITAQTEDSLITYCLSRKRALCATCKKSDPAETNLSRASRVRQVNLASVLLKSLRACELLINTSDILTTSCNIRELMLTCVSPCENGKPVLTNDYIVE